MQYPRTQTAFTEDFDFTAMNEKFNKDEVWGHLGKTRPHSSNTEEDDEAYVFEEENSQSVEFDVKVMLSSLTRSLLVALLSLFSLFIHTDKVLSSLIL